MYNLYICLCILLQFLQNDYSHVLKFDEVKEIHNRRYSLKEKAVEIFLTNGKTFLIAFHSQKVPIIFFYVFDHVKLVFVLRKEMNLEIIY